MEMKRTWGFFAVQRKDDFSCYRKDACKLSGTYAASLFLYYIVTVIMVDAHMASFK